MRDLETESDEEIEDLRKSVSELSVEPASPEVIVFSEAALIEQKTKKTAKKTKADKKSSQSAKKVADKPKKSKKGKKKVADEPVVAEEKVDDYDEEPDNFPPALTSPPMTPKKIEASDLPPVAGDEPLEPFKSDTPDDQMRELLDRLLKLKQPPRTPKEWRQACKLLVAIEELRPSCTEESHENLEILLTDNGYTEGVIRDRLLDATYDPNIVIARYGYDFYTQKGGNHRWQFKMVRAACKNLTLPTP
jgi:hypothetical protein